MRTKTLLVTVEFDGPATGMSVFCEEDPAKPAKGEVMAPGQRKKSFTYRVAGVPAGRKADEAGELLAGPFRSRNEVPGRTWHTAYNIPWERLLEAGAEAAEPGLTMEEAAASTGRSLSVMKRAVTSGAIAVTRPRRMSGAPAPVQVNPVDLAVYLEAVPLRPPWRPRRDG
jgi:hypothetical protein